MVRSTNWSSLHLSCGGDNLTWITDSGHCVTRGEGSDSYVVAGDHFAIDPKDADGKCLLLLGSRVTFSRRSSVAGPVGRAHTSTYLITDEYRCSITTYECALPRSIHPCRTIVLIQTLNLIHSREIASVLVRRCRCGTPLLARRRITI
jgi:hypothetical protein